MYSEYQCNICNKKFSTLFNLNRHKNKKTKCENITPNDLKCILCNKEFNYKSKLLEHKKTKKHINNVKQSNINGDNINQIGNNNSINFQNIINLTLQTKPFNETDLSYLRKWIIEDISNDLYIKTIEKEYLSIQDKVKSLFRGLLEILEQLHFNLNNEDNHNCKILLMFPGFKKPIYEYLILEIETNTNKISWKSLSYEDFIKELLNHLTKMNDTINNENIEKYIYYLKKYLINDEEIANEMKSFIETQLSDLYINFNNKQKKNN
jgi:hypothetical protein